jgi:hypothetical protein
MGVVKSATVAAAVACVGLVSAVPALADEGFNGVYRYNPELGDAADVTVSSNCATEGCVAHVVGEKGMCRAMPRSMVASGLSV